MRCGGQKQMSDFDLVLDTKTFQKAKIEFQNALVLFEKLYKNSGENMFKSNKYLINSSSYSFFSGA